MEGGHQDDVGEDHRDAEGAAQAVDGGAEDAGELGPHREPDRDVQVSELAVCDGDETCADDADSFTGVNESQSKALTEKAHVYLTTNGRISMAGLNRKNVRYFAEALDKAVRGAL